MKAKNVSFTMISNFTWTKLYIKWGSSDIAVDIYKLSAEQTPQDSDHYAVFKHGNNEGILISDES